MKLITLTTLLALISAPALSNEWQHTPLSPDHNSGYIEVDEGRYGISYDCTSDMTAVSLYAKESGATKGLNTVKVDGVLVLREDTSPYTTFQNIVTVGTRGSAKLGHDSVIKVNTMISALATGKQVTWMVPSGETYIITLTGSSKIKSCLI